MKITTLFVVAICLSLLVTKHSCKHFNDDLLNATYHPYYLGLQQYFAIFLIQPNWLYIIHIQSILIYLFRFLWCWIRVTFIISSTTIIHINLARNVWQNKHKLDIALIITFLAFLNIVAHNSHNKFPKEQRYKQKFFDCFAFIVRKLLWFCWVVLPHIVHPFN